MAVGGVVHLKDEIGVGGDEFRHAFGPVVGGTAGSIDEEHVAVGPVGVVLQVRIVQARRRERCVLRRVLQPRGTRWPDIDHCMMDILPAGGPDLRHANPAVLGESGGNNLVCVLDVAASG